MMQKTHQNNNLRMERKHARRKCTDINSDLLHKLYTGDLAKFYKELLADNLVTQGRL